VHSEKDADDLQASVNGLLRLSSASNIGGGTRDGSGQQQRPLPIRDARDSTADGDDMEVEDQEDANARGFFSVCRWDDLVKYVLLL
jgi:hypothetical protein